MIYRVSDSSLEFNLSYIEHLEQMFNDYPIFNAKGQRVKPLLRRLLWITRNWCGGGYLSRGNG